MPQAISERTAAVRPGTVQGLSALRVFPIIGISQTEPPYRVLGKEEIKAVQVTEIDEEGSVPSLKVTNTLDDRVYLMDGQELIGAKQNRILNTDILIPAKSTLNIPVSCVEAGRWRYTTEHFMPGQAASSLMRQRKAQRVHRSLREQRGHDAEQHAVWDDVAEAASSASAYSPTSAMHDTYKQREQDLTSIREQFTMPDDAVGLAVFYEDHFLGLDVFDRHSTLVHYWENLLNSYAIDWFMAQATDDRRVPPPAEVVRDILQRSADGTWERFGSPGEGIDCRLADDNLCGSALVWDERVALHVQIFPTKECRSRADQ